MSKLDEDGRGTGACNVEGRMKGSGILTKIRFIIIQFFLSILQLKLASRSPQINSSFDTGR